MGLILLIVLILLLVGSSPSMPHSRNWGYGPTGVFSLLLLILVVLLLTRVVPLGFGLNTVVP
jgi:Protein of unknown function (DUF3309)